MPTGTVLAVEDKYKLLVSIIQQQMDGQGVLRGVDWDKVGNELRLTPNVSRRRWNSL
jgi:hypothetical protein